MRRVLLAILLLTGPLAGCTSPDRATVEDPDWPTGQLLTYELTQEGETARETFLVYNHTPKGTDLLAWNLSRPNLTSPLTQFDEEHQPRAEGFSNAFPFPIEDGDEHEARIAGADVTVTWSQTPHEGPLDADRELEGVARTQDGEQLAVFGLSAGSPALLTYAEIDPPDGAAETWELVDARLHEGWNQPPSWTKGDWWTYEGSFRSEQGSSKVVYTTDDTSQPNTQRELSPVRVEDRVLMLPFQGWRDGDIAPQSGYISNVLSSFWSWPLGEGKTWSGSSSVGERGDEYQALSHLSLRAPLPDGSVTTTFAVEAYLSGRDEPFATWEYSPRAEHLVSWRITPASEEDPTLNFTLEDWGEAYHGEMEIPRRVQVDQIPARGGSFLSGPAEIDRTFDVPEQARTVQIAPRSFAVHEPDVDPEFRLTLTDANGTVVLEHNASQFQDQRLSLSSNVEASPGDWRLQVDIGEGVSVLARLYANWYETETVDFR
ncbi:hypothetical protein BRD56_08300 [Thermoplasmatales archaeon SW_10_69_26]|nr:MAG: hypothetical protein BRD56_08300 [Thermoplasmatales archaeon SW_10_69_26]